MTQPIKNIKPKFQIDRSDDDPNYGDTSAFSAMTSEESPEKRPGEIWRTKSGRYGAINNLDIVQYFDDEASAREWSKNQPQYAEPNLGQGYDYSDFGMQSTWGSQEPSTATVPHLAEPPENKWDYTDYFIPPEHKKKKEMKEEDRKSHQPGDIWKTSSGKFGAKNRNNDVEYFDSKDRAEWWIKGGERSHAGFGDQGSDPYADVPIDLDKGRTSITRAMSDPYDDDDGTFYGKADTDRFNKQWGVDPDDEKDWDSAEKDADVADYGSKPHSAPPPSIDNPPAVHDKPIKDPNKVDFSKLVFSKEPSRFAAHFVPTGRGYINQYVLDPTDPEDHAVLKKYKQETGTFGKPNVSGKYVFYGNWDHLFEPKNKTEYKPSQTEIRKTEDFLNKLDVNPHGASSEAEWFYHKDSGRYLYDDEEGGFDFYAEIRPLGNDKYEVGKKGSDLDESPGVVVQGLDKVKQELMKNEQSDYLKNTTRQQRNRDRKRTSDSPIDDRDTYDQTDDRYWPDDQKSSWDEQTGPGDDVEDYGDQYEEPMSLRERKVARLREALRQLKETSPDGWKKIIETMKKQNGPANRGLRYTDHRGKAWKYDDATDSYVTEAKREPGSVWHDGGGWIAINRNGVQRRYISQNGKEKAQEWSKDTETQPSKRAKPRSLAQKMRQLPMYDSRRLSEWKEHGSIWLLKNGKFAAKNKRGKVKYFKEQDKAREFSMSGSTPSNINNLTEINEIARILFERNYKREYELYHSKPEQKKRRAQRNKTRRKFERSGKVRKGDGMDVHHRDGNPSNTDSDNAVVMNKSKNRSMKERNMKNKNELVTTKKQARDLIKKVSNIKPMSSYHDPKEIPLAKPKDSDSTSNKKEAARKLGAVIREMIKKTLDEMGKMPELKNK